MRTNGPQGKEIEMDASDTIEQNSGGGDEALRRARRRVHQLRGFYSSLFIYVVIIALLAVLNVVTDSSYLWVGWVALFWGLGIAFHAYSVFVSQGPFGREWEERKIRELMERERRAGTSHP
jgi:two-component system LytT family sensor kinase